MLQQLELEGQRSGWEAEVRAARLDDRRDADVRPDDRVRRLDASAIDDGHPTDVPAYLASASQARRAIVPMSMLAAVKPGVPFGSVSGTCSVYAVRM